MTEQTSRLAIVIDSGDAERRIRRLREQLRELGQQTDDTSRNTDDLGRRTDRASRDTNRLSAAASKGKSALASMAKAASILGAAVGGIGAAAILATADSMQILNNQIRVATDGAGEYAIAQSEIERIAMSTFSSLDSVGQMYASNERALSSLGKSQQEVLLFTENISKAMSVSGGSAESQAAALTQLGQAMASGVLRGDEFNSIAEQAPVIMDLLTESLGVTRGELRAMAADGALTAEIVYDAVSGASSTLDGMMGQTVTTMSQAMTNIKTQWALLADGLVNGEGGIGDGLASSIQRVAVALQDARVWLDEFLNRAETIAFIESLADNVAASWAVIKDAIGSAVTAISEFLSKPETIETMSSIVSGLEMAWDNLGSVIKRTGEILKPVVDFFIENEEISIALAGGIAAVASAFVIYNAAVAIGAFVTGGFVAALALVTAPITLIVVAMTALVAAGIYVYRNWDEIKAKAISIWDSIKGYISTAIETMKAAFSRWVDNTKGAIINIKNTVINTLKELPSKMLQIGKDIVMGLVNGIKSGASSVTTAISSMAGSAITAAKDKLGIKSPSREFKKIGVHTADGMAKGIKKGAKTVKSEAQKMAEGAIEAVQTGIARIKKELALFGNNSNLADLEYDIAIGKYKGASQADLDVYRNVTAELEAKTKLAAANKTVQDSIDGLIRQQALFGNDSSLAALMYDIEHTKKFKDVSEELREELIKQTTALERMGAVAKATAAIQARFAQFGKDKEASQKAVDGVMSEINPMSPADQIEADYKRRLDIIAENELLITGIIGSSEAERLAIKQNYEKAKQDLELQKQSQTVGSIAAMFGMALGETSKGYKAMFAVQKAYDFVSAQSSSFTAIAEAWKSAPFPANLPAVATTTLQTGIIPAAIQALNPKGFKTGGYTGNMGVNQVAGAVHGQEYVFDAAATKRIGVDNLNAMRSGKAANDGGGDVNISVTVTGDNATVSGDNDKMGRDMANGIKAVVMDVMRKEKRQGGMLYGA